MIDLDKYVTGNKIRSTASVSPLIILDTLSYTTTYEETTYFLEPEDYLLFTDTIIGDVFTKWEDGSYRWREFKVKENKDEV